MTLRTRYRLIFLGVILIMASPLPAWIWGQFFESDWADPRWAWPLVYGLPHLSPFLAVGGLIGGMAISWLGWFSLVIVAMAFFRGRWFCRNLCPTGLLSETAGRVRPGAAKQLKRFPHLAPWLTVAALLGAVAGYPLLLWLDPLALFSGFLSTWRTPMLVSHLLPGLGLLLIVLLSLWQPHAWCFRLCPLGACQVAIGRLGRRIRQASPRKETPVSSERRRFFFLGAGILGALAVRRLGIPRRHPAVIRPPGAAAGRRFNALCARCGNCLRTCPQGIIHAAGGDAGLDGWLTPVIRFQPGYCHEDCHACTRVCPTAAIRPLSLEQKRSVMMGTAQVDREHCIAWGLGVYCMACQSVCPYDAITAVAHQGVDCPRVDPERCRGCGHCQIVCPGHGPAIRVASNIEH